MWAYKSVKELASLLKCINWCSINAGWMYTRFISFLLYFLLAWFIYFCFYFHGTICLIFTIDIFPLIHWVMSWSGYTVLSSPYSSHIALAVHYWTRVWEKKAGEIGTQEDFQLESLLLQDWSKIATLHIVLCFMLFYRFQIILWNIVFLSS